MTSSADEAGAAVALLRRPETIRERCGALLALAEADRLPHFALRPERLDAAAIVAQMHGTPYFSLDVSAVEGARVSAALEGSEEARGGAKLEFVDGRAAMSMIDQFDSGIFSVARTLVDWSARNKVCWHELRAKRIWCCQSSPCPVLRRVRIAGVHALGGMEAWLYFATAVGREVGKALPYRVSSGLCFSKYKDH